MRTCRLFNISAAIELLWVPILTYIYNFCINEKSKDEQWDFVRRMETTEIVLLLNEALKYVINDIKT